MNEVDRELVGYCAVDSGQMMLIDPCYMNMVDDFDEFYQKVCEDNDFKRGFGPVLNLGIATSTGFGDGSYPVYVTFSDEGEWGKRVKSVEIVFIDDDEGLDVDY